MSKTDYFILVGNAEHLDWFESNPDYYGEKSFWTVPKPAKIGDEGFVYLCKPVSRIVGKVEIIAEPFFNIGMFPDWANRWMAEIDFRESFSRRPELELQWLRKIFPEWGWLKCPRQNTKVPAEVLELFLELVKI
jgi:hypothetical protein